MHTIVKVMAQHEGINGVSKLKLDSQCMVSWIYLTLKKICKLTLISHVSLTKKNSVYLM